MRKIGLISLVLAAAVVSTAVLAGRLNGDFATQDDEFAGANQACVVVEDDRFAVTGTVIGSVSGGCDVSIAYATPLPHKGSSTALKTGKTKGSASVSQTIDAAVVVRFASGDTVCAAPWVASSTAEKCKVTASMKGTEPSTVESSRVTVTCDLGEGGTSLETEAGTAQFAALVGSFDGRGDVKLDDKGKLTIKHKGVPDTTAPAQAPCGIQTTSTTTTSTTTTTSSTTTTTTLVL